MVWRKGTYFAILRCAISRDDIKRRERAFKRGFDCGTGLDIYEYSDTLKGKAASPEHILISGSLLEEVFENLNLRYRRLLKSYLAGDELHRMEKYRLKEKITNILYDQQWVYW